MSLTQEEAKLLFEMKKIQVKELVVKFPDEGSNLEIELCSEDRRYNFQADIGRKGYKAKKLKYQNRSSKSYILRRLDFIGSPHGNPDINIDDELLKKYSGMDIPCPHIHLYIEGFNDRIAIPLSEIPEINIDEKDDATTIMEKFFQYCNIQIPKFREVGLFEWKI